MSQSSYSIAEARNQFAHLIREAETTYKPVQVTRRGTPVAVLLSIDEYERLIANDQAADFWQAYLDWRQAWEVDHTEEEDEDIFANLRDKSPGREIVSWE